MCAHEFVPFYKLLGTSDGKPWGEPTYHCRFCGEQKSKESQDAERDTRPATCRT